MTLEQEKTLLEDVAEMKRAILGEEKLKQAGLVDRVFRIEKWIRKADLRNAAVTGGVLVFFAILKYLFLGRVMP